VSITSEIVKYLRPNSGFVLYEDDISSIILDEGVKPITKKEFDDAKAIVELKMQEDEAAKIQARADLLARLGITEAEAKVLLS
jgi:hypothetical protein